MRRRRLLWQIYPSYLFIVVISLLAVGVFASRALERFYLQHLEEDLEARAALVREHLLARGGGQIPDASTTDALVKRLGPPMETRLTVIRPDGLVLADSVKDPASMGNHADRPEIIEAEHNGLGSATRFSETLRQGMLYVAVPVLTDGQLLAVVRAAVPVTAIHTLLRRVYGNILAVGVWVALAAAVISFLAVRHVSKPLNNIRRGAERLAAGELDTHLPVPRSYEMAILAEAFNEMALRLKDRVRAIERQNDEQGAVFASMVEGVVAIDNDGRVFNVNGAGARLLQSTREGLLGKSVQEAVRNPPLQDLVEQAMQSEAPVEGDVTLTGNGEQCLQIHGSALHDADGRRIGALIVLNDVTRLRRLERVRRDFVANVSHELKTPVTSIKGFVETLQDGAAENPEERERFLSIIRRQVDRLNLLIDDILSLSTIEDGAEKGRFELVDGPLSAVFKEAMEVCGDRAARKEVQLELDCDRDIHVPMHAPLLEQALVNLIDNAVKFSEPGGRVELVGRVEGAEVLIQVRDHGAGIERKHLPRLFERFYRVDKGRSRQQGGTGLGLAIVKHVATAHGGHVDVESSLGKGSVFTVVLPRG